MSNSEEGIAAVAYLGKTLRVKISDGRVIEGQFQCLDKDMNLILCHATEYFGMGDASISENPQDLGLSSRSMGSAMVPGQHILNILVQED